MIESHYKIVPAMQLCKMPKYKIIIKKLKAREVNDLQKVKKKAANQGIDKLNSMHKPNTLAASPSMHCCLHSLLSLQTQTIETTNTTGKLSQLQLTRFHNNLTNRDLAARDTAW
ncbi:hypothetical protein OUZ56_030997 [Daphnia magna]|uniref:Uncharacterized protein n=1 Tax=Daphnia magna TaxID=35525 RepID=A0ABQ9ZT36_9CRUS|nr:hypothetical protein OUZ56_030997 [Daphnia magna]